MIIKNYKFFLFFLEIVNIMVEITDAQIDRLATTQTTQISVTTQTRGHLEKLGKIKAILEKSAKIQLMVAAYYNNLILESNDFTNNATFIGQNYENDTITINAIPLTLAADVDLNSKARQIPLVQSYLDQKRVIDDAINSRTGTANEIQDGGQSYSLKSKKKKKKTSRRG